MLEDSLYVQKRVKIRSETGQVKKCEPKVTIVCNENEIAFIKEISLNIIVLLVKGYLMQ